MVRVGDHQQPLHHQQQPPSCSRRANAFHEWLSEVVETIPAQTLPSGQSESFINGIHQMLSNAFAGACSKGQPKKIGGKNRGNFIMGACPKKLTQFKVDDDEQQLNASNWHKFIRRRRRGADGFACLIGTCIVIFAIPVIVSYYYSYILNFYLGAWGGVGLEMQFWKVGIWRASGTENSKFASSRYHRFFI